MVAEHVISGDGDAKKATIRTETWYLDDEHVRSEETSPSAGSVVFGQSRNDDDFWIYGVFDGNTVPASGQGTQRAVHGPAGELSFGKVPVESGGSGLADLLSRLSARDCFDASVTGEEAVAARIAYVIEVRPTSERCSLKPEAGGVASPSGKLDRDSLTRLWVDKDTFITLRSDFYSAGRLLSSYTVIKFEIDPDFAPGTFVYQPGSGVQVIEVGSLGEAKQALAGLLESEKPGDGVPPKPTP
jgi:outer membrane lipoprotein-sorting protein